MRAFPQVTRERRERMPRERADDEAPQPDGSASTAVAGRSRAFASGEHALPEPVIRALPPRVPSRPRRSRPRDAGQRQRLEIVPSVTLGKDVHFRRRRRACQFGRREDRRASAPAPAARERKPLPRQRNRRGQPRRRRARSRSRRGRRTARPHRASRRSPQLGAGQPEPPQAVQRRAARSPRRSCPRRARRPSECACRSSIVAPSRCPVASRSASAARIARSAVLGHAGHVARADDRAVVARARASPCRRDRRARTATRAGGSRRRAVRSRAGTG